MLMYFAGLLTLPVLAVVAWAAWSALGKSNRLDERGCKYCKAAGLPIHTYEAFEHMRVTVWLMDKWHNEVIRHRRAHREAWQAWYDSLTPGGTLQKFYGRWQHRWGAPAA